MHNRSTEMLSSRQVLDLRKTRDLKIIGTIDRAHRLERLLIGQAPMPKHWPPLRVGTGSSRAVPIFGQAKKLNPHRSFC
jgi:hypothetical protein